MRGWTPVPTRPFHMQIVAHVGVPMGTEVLAAKMGVA